MKIKKRNGELVPFNPNKILNRLKSTAKNLNVDYTTISINVQTLLYDGITTKSIDEEAARLAASYSTNHPDYSLFAARITSSRLHKELGPSVADWKNRLKGHLKDIVFKRQEEWGVEPDYSYDHTFDFMGIGSFMTVYGVKKDKRKLIELPCEMLFRVALYLSESKEEFEVRYKSLIDRKYGGATPVLTNTGSHNNTMISCSVNELIGDSLEGIHDSLKSIAQMSKSGAGIGLWASNLRSQETEYNTKGKAGGIVRFAKMVNEDLRFFKQNEDRRGKGALYLNIWHKDLFSFLDLVRKEGSEETTTRDLMIAVVINDLFYKRLLEYGNWSTFCPHEIKKLKGYNLYDYYGDEFEKRYLECEADTKLSRNTYPCKEIIEKICSLQTQTGIPYVLNIDNVNKVNNQENYGIIKMSQLCIEIVQYTDSDTSAQCCLGSIILGNFIKNGKVDYLGIQEASAELNYMLNRVIDKNEWVNEYAKKGGVDQRATAIGVCGLADLFYQLNIPFESEEATEVNRIIFENIYYGAIKGSVKFRKENKISKRVTDLIDKTNVGKGIFVFEKYKESVPITLNWNALREEVLTYGVSNSMFCAPMPTATSANLAMMYEMTEPNQDLVVVRKTISGAFPIINKYLVKDLETKGIFSDMIMNEIKTTNSLNEIDFTKYTDDSAWVDNLRKLYKTVWEIPQKSLIKLAAGRQRFIDQSQSMNLYWADPTLSKLVNALVYGWQSELKTGVYYTKTKTKIKADKTLGIEKSDYDKPSDSPFDCMGCSS